MNLVTDNYPEYNHINSLLSDISFSTYEDSSSLSERLKTVEALSQTLSKFIEFLLSDSEITQRGFTQLNSICANHYIQCTHSLKTKIRKLGDQS